MALSAQMLIRVEASQFAREDGRPIVWSVHADDWHMADKPTLEEAIEVADGLLTKYPGARLNIEGFGDAR